MTGGKTEQGDGAATTGGILLRRLLKARNHSRADAGEAPGMPQSLPQTPARAAATAVGRAAENLYSLPVHALSILPGGTTLAELSEMLPDPALLSVVAGPNEGLGVVALDPVIVTTLIEVQALGRVTDRPVESRRLTRSDAIMCTEFVNRLLAELQAEISGLEGFECYAGFAYASHLEDARPLMLMLEDTVFRSLNMTLSIGDGGLRRDARIFIALPQRRIAAKATAPRLSEPNSVAKAAVSSPAARPDGLAPAVQDAPVDLFGVLCRRKVSLGKLRELRPGRLLTLPRVSLSDARIETRHGQVLAYGKLGEADGCHAIRLHDPATVQHEAGAARPMTSGADIAAFVPVTTPVTPELATYAPLPEIDIAGFEPPIGDLRQPDVFRENDPLPMEPLTAIE